VTGERKVLREAADLLVPGDPPRFPNFREFHELIERHGVKESVSKRLSDAGFRARVERFIKEWRGAEIHLEDDRLVLERGRARAALILVPGDPPPKRISGAKFLGAYGRGLTYRRAGSSGYAIALDGETTVMVIDAKLIPFEIEDGPDPGVRGLLAGVERTHVLREIPNSSVLRDGQKRFVRLGDRAYPEPPLRLVAPAGLGFMEKGIVAFCEDRPVLGLSAIEGVVAEFLTGIVERTGIEQSFPDLALWIRGRKR
jgi:hypothetical protein